MFNKSIAYRLSIYLSLAVISVFIAFIIITFLFNSKIINQSIRNDAIRQSTDIKVLINRQLITTKEISTNIAEQILFYAQHDDAELLILKLMEKYEFLNAIHINIDSAVPNILFHNYFFYNSGDSIIQERENQKIYHCENEKLIFESVISNDTASWTEVFNCPRNNKMVVSYYCPIQITDENNNPISVGSVICELSLVELNQAINNLKVAENGYSVLISGNGKYLSHPNKEWIFNKNLLTTPSKQYNSKKINIAQILKEGRPGFATVYPEFLDYRKSWIYYSMINETGWAILFIVPYDELYAPLYFLILRMLFIAVLGILIIFFIVTYISNRLIQPLSVVTSKLKKFSSLTGESELNTLNEITMVADSLNYLQSWYEKFKLTQRQEEKLNYQRRIDLMEASDIQMSLINTNFSDFNKRKDINLYAIYKPAKIVSGDLFDYFFIDDDNLFFTIGDVSGKGISAAFFMSVAQTIVKSRATLKQPAKIVFNANNELYTANHHQFFLTLFLGVLNTKTGVLNYCNAAHTPTIIISNKGKITELRQSHGMPLGIYKNTEYLDQSITLKRGDSIVLYTDGVTDLQNEEKELFGVERFLQTLQDKSKLSPQNLINHIETELEEYKGKVKPVDDITVMAIKFKPVKKA